MADLSLINMDNIPRDKVGLGSTVRVFDNDKNEEVEYKLVTTEETDVAAGKISTSSPIGRALLNKSAGQRCTGRLDVRMRSQLSAFRAVVVQASCLQFVGVAVILPPPADGDAGRHLNCRPNPSLPAHKRGSNRPRL